MGPWDANKKKANKRKHRISFETALLVFHDPRHVSAEDYIDDNNEMRFQTLGLVNGTLIFVAHVYRVIENQETPWLINARKATTYEQQIYWSHQ